MGREDVSFDDSDDIFDDADDDITADEEKELSKKSSSLDKRRLIEDRLEQRQLKRSIDDYYDFDLDDDDF